MKNKPNDSVANPKSGLINTNSALRFLRDQAMQGNPNAIALWALSVLELDQPLSDELISLIDGNNEQELWIGELACLLVKYLHDNSCNNPSDSRPYTAPNGKTRKVGGSTNDQLSNAIWLALNAFQKDPTNNNHDFFEVGTLDFDDYLKLFGDWADHTFFTIGNNDSRPLDKTLSVLRELANDYAEAQYILGLLGDSTDNWLVKSSDLGFKLASYRLGFGQYEENPKEALKHLERLFGLGEDVDETPILKELTWGAHRRVLQLVSDIEREKARAEHKIAEEKARSDAIQDMMAMFAHQFRGSVGSILFNAEHQHDERLYLNLAHSMFGLLDTFSIVSTEPEKLSSSLKADTQGEESPAGVLLRSLKLVLAELLSRRNRLRISPYYLAYAKRLKIAPGNLKQTEWMRDKDCVNQEIEFQMRWEQDVGEMMGSNDFQSIVKWLESHMLPVQIRGFEESPIRFADYGSKASFLTVVFTEILVNAVKYSVAGTEKPVVITWSEEPSDIVFSCSNPSTSDSRLREKSKGSGRGHKFLDLIAKQMGGQFIADVSKDDSVVTMVFPRALMKGTA